MSARSSEFDSCAAISAVSATLRSRQFVPALALALAALSGCAHAPTDAPRPEWLAGAPPATRVARRIEEPMICRTTKPTGSHVEQQVCLTPEDDRRQRDSARQILRAAMTAPWRGR